MSRKTEIQTARTELADLKERLDALEQAAPLFEANVTLAVDMAKALITSAKESLVRLSKVEADNGRRIHEMREIRQVAKVSQDWLDRLEGAAAGRA